MTQHSPAAAPESPKRGWHPTDYLRILSKRRWVAVPGFLLVFLSGAIGSMQTVPIYEARTQLLIEKDARRATSLNTVLEERESWYQDDFYPTQYRILQSRALALRAAAALDRGQPEVVPAESGLSFSLSDVASAAIGSLTSLFAPAPADPPTAAAAAEEATGVLRAKADRVLGGLIVTPVRNSRLVDVRFRSPDPNFAARAANTLAAEYISQSLDFRLAATTQANDWLTGQLRDQQRLVEESERRLQEYKEQHNAGSVDDKQNIVVQKLNALNQQLVQARLERMDKESIWATVRDLQARGTPLDTAPAVQNSPVVQKLKADLAQKENERAKLGTQYGPAYPAMRDLTRQIETARTELTAEIAKVVGGIEAEYQAARAKETSVQQSLDAQQRESIGLDRKLLEYSAIEREAASNRQLYESLLVRAKETGAAGEYRGSNIQVIDRAEVPRFPVLPNTSRDLLFAAIAGVLVACALAFGIEHFDSRIKLPDEIRTHLGLPFLGMIPAFENKHEGGEGPLLWPDVPPAFAESMRAIRTAVLFSSAAEGGRVVVVTSTGPDEGKTLVSSSLAITLAQAGQRTLIVDADMRRPRVHEALGRAQEPGLSNVLVGETPPADAVRVTPVPNLSILAAGHIPPNPVELLCSPTCAALVADLKSRFDWVVIDAPPVMPVTDAAVLSNVATGVIFVVGAEMTARQNAIAALDQLRGVGARFIGAILNRVQVTRHSYYYSPYYRKAYGKYYQRTANRA